MVNYCSIENVNFLLISRSAKILAKHKYRRKAIFGHTSTNRACVWHKPLFIELMVKLSQSEIIQILRKRIGLNQGRFGAKVFDTSFESGRTKIKNIELGKQRPNEADLKKMAEVLNVPVLTLMPNSKKADPKPKIDGNGIYLHPKVLEYFPNLGPYMDMLNKAVLVKDEELIAHLAAKIAFLINPQPSNVIEKILETGR